MSMQHFCVQSYLYLFSACCLQKFFLDADDGDEAVEEGDEDQAADALAVQRLDSTVLLEVQF